MKDFHSVIQLETPRLILRQWKDADFQEFYALNSDIDVMRYFPCVLTRHESDLLASKFQNIISTTGWGFWAVELKENHQFIGFIGLQSQPTQFDFSPCVEIGWRLAKQYWHQGYATEATQICLQFAFEQLALKDVVSFTAKLNIPSQKVMQRLNMQLISEFNHPRPDVTHPLACHMLYRITQRTYFQTVNTTK